MANSKYLRWLNIDDLETNTAKRFAQFCDEDIEQRSTSTSFDASIYEEAMKLVIDRLEVHLKNTEENNLVATDDNE